MKQGVLQDESMEIHVASMSNGGEHKNMKKNSSKSEQNSGEERQNGNWKQETSMDQEPYANQEDDAPKAWMALDTNWWTSLV